MKDNWHIYELYKERTKPPRKLLKFNLTIIRYCIIENYHRYTYVIDLTKCPDYDRYKKWYKLLYGV